MTDKINKNYLHSLYRKARSQQEYLQALKDMNVGFVYNAGVSDGWNSCIDFLMDEIGKGEFK